MSKLRFPDLPPGPLHALMSELHRLHARAGWPSTRDLARAQAFSHTVVHAMFTRPVLPNWTVLCPVVERMAGIAPYTDVEQCVKKFDRLWDEAERFDGLEPPFLPPAGPDDPGQGPDGTDGTNGTDGRGGIGGGGTGSRPPTPRPGPTAPAEPMLPDRGDSRAVIVGASTYDHLPPLPSVRTSATDLSAVLTDTGDAPFLAERTTLITDPADPMQVLSAIDRASRDCGDTLLVYFAGHGLVTRHGDLVLATTGTDQDHDYTGISYDSLRRIVATSTARRTMVILDCCYSGRVLDAMGPLTGLTDAPSTYVLTSAGTHRLAFAPADQRHTAFTGLLIDILRHGVSGGARLLDVESIYRELRLRARQRAFPSPELRARPGAHPLALAANAAYQPAAAVPQARAVGGRGVAVIERAAGGGEGRREHGELELSDAAWEGRLADYLEANPAAGKAELYRYVSELVYERITRRAERAQGHVECATAADLLLPDCHDRHQDRVEAVLADLLRHTDQRIPNLHGWLTARLNAVTVDATRRRRGLVGAQQRPRLPAWLREALGDDPWLTALALEILTWVGIPTALPDGPWPLAAWAERRASETGVGPGTTGTTEQQVASDVERVLAAMKGRPEWYERYVEVPLSRKQFPPAPDPIADDAQQRRYEPDEASEARLREFAAQLLDAVRAKLLTGEDPRTAVTEALGRILAETGTDNDIDEDLARLLTDPETANRLIEVAVALAVAGARGARDGGAPEA